MDGSLDKQVENLKAGIKKLIGAENCPPAERKQLRAKLRDIIDQQKKVAASKVKQEGKKYELALEALSKANGSIAEAIKNCEKAEKTIEFVGKAADAIAGVIV